jgi:outer membrane phospholipase A
MSLNIALRAGAGNVSPLRQITLLGILLAGGLLPRAQAAVSLMQPPRVVAGDAPMQLSLLYTQDGATSRRYAVPAQLSIVLVSNDGTPRKLTLSRRAGAPAALTLHAGQFRRIDYLGAWPQELRGTVRIDVQEIDAAPVLVTLDRAPAADRKLASERATAQDAHENAAIAPAGASSRGDARQAAAVASVSNAPSSTSAGVTDTAAGGGSRLTFNEPFYFGIGANGDTNAKFQISLKYRVIVPRDPASKGLLDNLYFGYTQTSIWDLSERSAPFRDTSYRPSLFYYVPDVGLRSRWFSAIGVAAGLEHESNGKAGTDSRSINTAFIKPSLVWGDPLSTHLTVSPKLIYYIEKSDNSDIARYRGYADLQIKYGDPNALELSTTLRKGNHALYGSVDAQLTYPMNKLVGGAFGGYLWVGYFNGWGEDLLDYNRRQHWNVRVGYSIAR